MPTFFLFLYRKETLEIYFLGFLILLPLYYHVIKRGFFLFFVFLVFVLLLLFHWSHNISYLNCKLLTSSLSDFIFTMFAMACILWFFRLILFCLCFGKKLDLHYTTLPLMGNVTCLTMLSPLSSIKLVCRSPLYTSFSAKLWRLPLEAARRTVCPPCVFS